MTLTFPSSSSRALRGGYEVRVAVECVEDKFGEDRKGVRWKPPIVDVTLVILVALWDCMLGLPSHKQVHVQHVGQLLKE